MSITFAISGLYASLLGLLLLVLSLNIIRLRLKFQIGIGDGKQKILTRAIRVHANFIEYMPLALILLVCYESHGAEALWLHILGMTLLLGRILHAIGLGKSVRVSLGRQLGMLLTFVALFFLAFENVRLFLSA